ncbi:MurR/RpiR family transcriptional regulator [Rhodobium gokarnense]|uniref:DNA-binding MurR/RpiR family transcriptional regulator n=1 Tax=Rhodobium gokarnense TaxID=364296 RepID=A0ABT3HAS0_9HYPH|nr:MurR/RpiR family transcriptional regulator [Rhodobium gokarnense]MCW2307498.1 DNA-binding MurR/RpiR family transcriptional regulator [Rhodobium gokarnense]
MLVSVRGRIEEMVPELTSSERKVATVILADYPFAGLQTIQELADRAKVSAPSITRFVAKLGYHGYQAFQRGLIAELKESHRSPVDLKPEENPATPDRFLADYADRLATLIKEMAAAIPQQQFDAVCDLIADPSRNIFLIGGRISDTIARMLSMHLRQIRGRIHHLPLDPEIWPDYVLRIRRQDVFILFDFRRYQPSLTELARLVSERRQAQVVVVTDKWLAPASRHAGHVLVVPTETGTAWDGQAAAVTLIEAMIVSISERDWEATRKRIEQWDDARITLGRSGPDMDIEEIDP